MKNFRGRFNERACRWREGSYGSNQIQQFAPLDWTFGPQVFVFGRKPIEHLAAEFFFIGKEGRRDVPARDQPPANDSHEWCVGGDSRERNSILRMSEAEDFESEFSNALICDSFELRKSVYVIGIKSYRQGRVDPANATRARSEHDFYVPPQI